MFKITQLDKCPSEARYWGCNCPKISSSWIGKHIAPELAQNIIKCFLNAKFVTKSTEASSVIMTNARRCALKSLSLIKMINLDKHGTCHVGVDLFLYLV